MKPPRLTPPRSVAVTPQLNGIALREAIFNRIWQAVLAHRLPPGTKLVEDRLGELLSTNLAQVCDALARVANDGLVEIVPNRSASMACPTSQ